MTAIHKAAHPDEADEAEAIAEAALAAMEAAPDGFHDAEPEPAPESDPEPEWETEPDPEPEWETEPDLEPEPYQAPLVVAGAPRRRRGASRPAGPPAPVGTGAPNL